MFVSDRCDGYLLHRLDQAPRRFETISVNRRVEEVGTEVVDGLRRPRGEPREGVVLLLRLRPHAVKEPVDDIEVLDGETERRPVLLGFRHRLVALLVRRGASGGHDGAGYDGLPEQASQSPSAAT